ncbi:hypothetical protein [Dongia deserti]|uniref:hypothetical protein n=1 Tax=Dongia deserti TaxID=2268030 RepID=UPI000E6591FE|nr:hypothetical protein [Dongia deserti]
MPPNFDDKLTINDHGCLTPKGPLGLAADETALRLDIWIFQDRAACMGFLLNPTGATWTINSDPHEDHFGNPFQPGAAIGMGLLVKKNTAGQAIVEQWNRPITLVGK